MSGRACFLAATMLVAVPCAAQPAATPSDSARTAAPMMTAPAASVTPTPPDFPRGRISGYVFGDYYDNVSGDPTHHYNASGADSDKVNIDNSGARQIGRDLNGVQIRRAYFQLDNDLSIRYSSRFRLEADSRTLTSDAKIGVFVKNAYLQVRSVYPRADFFFGMQDTPIWLNMEDFWGYRSIEKMMQDFQGLGSASDLGLGLKGSIDPDHRVGYWAMIGNGQFQRPENNRDKRFYLALPVHVGDLRLEPYVDYENGPQSTDRATYRMFAGYELKQGSIGVEALDRVNHRPSGGNQEPVGLSVFARATATSTLGGFARFDFWKPDRRAPNRVDSQLWIAGLDWQPLKDVHFMPNVEATQYTAEGTAVAPPHHDLQARLTIYWRYSRPQS